MTNFTQWHSARTPVNAVIVGKGGLATEKPNGPARPTEVKSERKWNSISYNGALMEINTSIRYIETWLSHIDSF